MYQAGAPLDELPLHEETKATIRRRLGGHSLWKHQTDTLKLLLGGKNAVIATGTSSGKTLCYQIPILDDLVRDPSPGLRAVIIYPLNALVNDQLTEWEKMLAEYPHITFARFTGQTPDTQINYKEAVKDTLRKKMADKGLTQNELQQKVQHGLEDRLRSDIPNRLNHRDAIRSNPPHVLVTNFSMLEYLLERPVDVPIFENSQMKFLVLDEAHAYRGVQATEIAFLIRRLKDRLSLERLVCIATSATLGKQGEPDSQAKVRQFTSDLFGEEFLEPNPIYGTVTDPLLKQPSLSPEPDQYLKAIEALRNNPKTDLRPYLGTNIPDKDIDSLLSHDSNLYRLRKEILTKPTLLKDAAKALWPNEEQAEEGLQSLIEIVATAKADQSREDLLPTRLHYFVRAQDGLHICLHKHCPGRRNKKPAFFVSRKNASEIPEGHCPDCHRVDRISRLVEVVTCRKCGYLYGALQDLGPRRAQNPDSEGEPKPYFDSFSTELGWMADSYWSYFSVEDDLPTFLTRHALLIEKNKMWKLDHERLFVKRSTARYLCSRCGIAIVYSVKNCCPRNGCDGRLETRPFDPAKENIIARWVSGKDALRFSTLKAEEHTAQIEKGLAKTIEDDFKADGVNLLSSTTTFEMGIDIGDLQKVLLRNAPPSSANYIQRVGRAGRGNDKNAISVTLCRRTKYDADMWSDPPRLMSGEVRTPTVFIENQIIAQRHFNAAVFAKFLRIKIMDERAIGQVKQQIPLELFLSPETRIDIPEKLGVQIRPKDLFLDFLNWVTQKQDKDIFQTKAGKSLLTAIGSFESGKTAARERYSKILMNISGEFSALMVERKKLFSLGAHTSDIEQAIKNLLSKDIIAVLAKWGFLPRYAFPLDVVTLETGRTRWSSDADVELSRDRGIAIAEYAPGSQVIAHKKVFTSSGLYVVSEQDLPKREWYSKCPSCNQIRTAQIKEELIGECAVCQRSITAQYIFPFVAPRAFSVRVDKEQVSVRYRRSTLIRQRQTTTHFIDHIEESSFKNLNRFRLALKESGKLFRYNSGPEAKGFMLCPKCGCSEPRQGYKPGKKHQRLRPIAGVMECNNDHPWTGGVSGKAIAYGHEFQSFCLVARPITPPGSAVESLAYALQRGLCKALNIEPSDIGVSWRWLANKKEERIGSEIILYDRTPGGAGFVKEGRYHWDEVVEESRRICEACRCENACYDCLKDYGNQTHHEKLDRRMVLQFLSDGG